MQFPAFESRAAGDLCLFNGIRLLQQRGDELYGHGKDHGDIVRRDTQKLQRLEHGLNCSGNLQGRRGLRQDVAADHDGNDGKHHLQALQDSLHREREDPPVPDRILGGEKQGVHQEHQKVQAPETHDRTERQPEVQPAAEKQRQHKDENRGIAEGGIRRDHGCGEQKKTEELCPGIETVQEALPRKILTGQTAAHSLSPPIIRSTAGRSSE